MLSRFTGLRRYLYQTRYGEPDPKKGPQYSTSTRTACVYYLIVDYGSWNLNYSWRYLCFLKSVSFSKRTEELKLQQACGQNLLRLTSYRRNVAAR